MTTKPLAETIKGLEALRERAGNMNAIRTSKIAVEDPYAAIATLDAALTALREQGEPVAWVDAREISGLQSGLVMCADLYPKKHKGADTPLYAAHPQGEWVSVPRGPTECRECPAADCCDCPRKPARWVPQS